MAFTFAQTEHGGHESTISRPQHPVPRGAIVLPPGYPPSGTWFTRPSTAMGSHTARRPQVTTTFSDQIRRHSSSHRRGVLPSRASRVTGAAREPGFLTAAAPPQAFLFPP